MTNDHGPPRYAHPLPTGPQWAGRTFSCRFGVSEDKDGGEEDFAFLHPSTPTHQTAPTNLPTHRPTDQATGGLHSASFQTNRHWGRGRASGSGRSQRHWAVPHGTADEAPHPFPTISPHPPTRTNTLSHPTTTTLPSTIDLPTIPHIPPTTHIRPFSHHNPFTPLIPPAAPCPQLYHKAQAVLTHPNVASLRATFVEHVTRYGVTRVFQSPEFRPRGPTTLPFYQTQDWGRISTAPPKNQATEGGQGLPLCAAFLFPPSLLQTNCFKVLP